MPPEQAIDTELKAHADFERQLATAANGAFSPAGLMTNYARCQWQYWLQYADTHCWQCDGEITQEDWNRDLCPTCGGNLIPF